MKLDEILSLQYLFDCMSQVKIQVADNFLQLNEVLFWDSLNIPSKTLHPIINTVGTCAQNLGIIFTPALKIDKQIEIQLLNQRCFSLG